MSKLTVSFLAIAVLIVGAGCGSGASTSTTTRGATHSSTKSSAADQLLGRLPKECRKALSNPALSSQARELLRQLLLRDLRRAPHVAGRRCISLHAGPK